MDRGWIKLHRKILKSAIFTDSDYLKVWLFVLLSASHEEKEMLIDGSKILIQPGEFITSRLKMGVSTGINQHKIDRILKYLKSEQQIEQQNFNKCRLISITNWQEYQTNEQQNEQRMSSERAADEQRMSTIKNDKNDKNDKKSVSTKHKGNGKLTSFTKSAYFDFDTFRQHLHDWEERKVKHYYDLFIEKERLTGKYHYKDWALAARTWDRKQPWSPPSEGLTIEQIMKGVKSNANS